MEAERRAVEADRDEASASPREPDRRRGGPPRLGGVHPGVGVTAEHRAGTDRGQLAEAPRLGTCELPAQRLVGGDRWIATPPAQVAELKHAGPHVAGRFQLGEAAPTLPSGQAQGDPGGAVDDLGAVFVLPPGHAMTVGGGCITLEDANVAGGGTSRSAYPSDQS